MVVVAGSAEHHLRRRDGQCGRLVGDLDGRRDPGQRLLHGDGLVTAANAGSYINSLAAGALQTSNGSNPSQTTATLTVLLPTTTPGLSLNKTADRTTYTAVGQVIVYTYVVRNIGGVTLTGPFTVTDDKLGTFACGSAATILAPGASVTCTKSYTIKAKDLGGATSLLTGVIAQINTGAWLGGAVSTQDTDDQGCRPRCAERHVSRSGASRTMSPTDLHNQPARLYSTVGVSLPADVAGLAWNKINYLLNHKIRGAGNRRPRSSRMCKPPSGCCLVRRIPSSG